MTLETIATLGDDAAVSLPAMADWHSPGQTAGDHNEAARSYTKPWGTIRGAEHPRAYVASFTGFLRVDGYLP